MTVRGGMAYAEPSELTVTLEVLKLNDEPRVDPNRPQEEGEPLLNRKRRGKGLFQPRASRPLPRALWPEWKKGGKKGFSRLYGGARARASPTRGIHPPRQRCDAGSRVPPCAVRGADSASARKPHRSSPGAGCGGVCSLLSSLRARSRRSAVGCLSQPHSVTAPAV
ncbi:hypothetical protein T492DRAFT_173889 [Pavlovales sp. CCMP2436]|nr:hypothetical protein T492DRAFT_173889 [Pavlovales sp. CCMP2436]